MTCVILNAFLTVLSVLFIVFGSTKLLIKLTMLLGYIIAKEPIHDNITLEGILIVSGVTMLLLI
jgi:hypothetical protein